MTIPQSQSPVSPSVGAIGEIPLTSFTIDELEALLEAAAYSLRMGQNLKHSLEDCSTHSMFDTEFLVELKFQEQSRDELLELVGAIALRALANKIPTVGVGDRILGGGGRLCRFII